MHRWLLERTALCLTLATVCVGVVPATAQAQASAAEKAAAEALFDDALQLIKQSHFAEACPKLEQSQRIDPGVGTLLYLGDCYEHTGRTASAWATFREASSTAHARGQDERARVALDRANRLQPALSKLTIEVSPEALGLSGLSVTRDEKPVEPSLFGVPIPVDPGTYHIEARAPGYLPFASNVLVGPDKDLKTLSVPKLEAGKAPPSAPTPVAPASTSVIAPSPARAAAANSLRGPGLVVGALGVVGLGIGSYFGVRAISKNSDAEKFCPRGRVCDDARGVSLTNDAKSAANISNVAFAVGAAAVIVGVVLFVQAGPEKTARIQISPALSEQQAGLSVSGAFQ
jgi:hypothetical protein